jgi:hypothetical protein
VSENKLIRIIIRLETRKGTEGRRNVHNEAMHSLFSSKNVMRMNKSKRMKLGI